MTADDHSTTYHPAEVERLMDALSVDFARLAECVVGSGWRLVFPAAPGPCIHYNISGRGRLVIGALPPIELLPHTLVVVPAGHPFSIEVSGKEKATLLKTVESSMRAIEPGAFQRFIAGPALEQLNLVCGYFRASFGVGIDPFATLSTVLVEQFEETDRIHSLLTAARSELAGKEVGAGAMTGTLLKLVFLTVFRRSLVSPGVWSERFSALGDTNISRAFNEMLARPGASHSVASLARQAALSRSAFMARFSQRFGVSPMTALRQLRMKRAATLLAMGTLSVEQVARDVGYASRSSFIRAFREYHGHSPLAHGSFPNRDNVFEE
jgi:AraC-like DNA-binding protein